MPDHAPGQVTQLLLSWGKGDRNALDRMMPLIFQELRRLAQSYLRQERPDHTLQATALVHEAYLRLVDRKHQHIETRSQFFAVAAQAMRRILIDHARRKRAAKRGGGERKITFDDAAGNPKAEPVDLLALDDALNALASEDARKAKVVELRYFGGLSLEETAEVLGVSRITVSREWQMAKAMLQRLMRHQGH